MVVRVSANSMHKPYGGSEGVLTAENGAGYQGPDKLQTATPQPQGNGGVSLHQHCVMTTEFKD